MKIEMRSTPEIRSIDGVPCRVWVGRTERGVECFVMVHRIAVLRDDETAEFERELHETEPAQSFDPVPDVSSVSVPAIDMRNIL